MLTYAAVFVTALVTAFVLTPLIRNWARGWEPLVDTPSAARHVHKVPIPRVGGIAIFAAFLFGTLVALLFELGSQIRETTALSVQFLLPCIMMFALGLVDDIRRLRAGLKFLIEVVIAVWFHFSVQGITTLPNPLTGGVIELGVFGLPITVLWLVGISNAFNLIDGVDGLSAGAALFSTLTLAYVAAANGNVPLAILLCALAGGTAGFLKYNFNPATIFMGDCGSLFIGFTLAGLALLHAQKSATIVTVTIPLLAFGLPIMETALSIGRRFLAGKPIFEADRRHMHHQLLARGYSHRTTTILLYGLSAFFALVSLLAYNSPNRLLGLILLTLGIVVWIAVQHFGYHEFGEIGRVIQRSLNQRVIIANNIRVHELIEALTRSESFDEFYTHLSECFEATDFARVELHLPLDYVWHVQAHDGFRFARRGNLVIATWSADTAVDDVRSLARLVVPLNFSSGSHGSLELHRCPDQPLLFDVNLLFGKLRTVIEQTVCRLASDTPEPMGLRDRFSDSGSTLLPKITSP
ncbi:undecaprenyl/decaprenyl-phosphate alpha-N-acetylglucosaminyl 1-phosphate transferase [Chloracidobacterium validum]|uniref:Undecaprenyl/decaprenyl-phosphate alpha-N-acetylglucosaminyl 1-phosphate transferase n=1 Tax=Chloracidobacterium validum TaxID=2821543 RepID=A0ABX8BC24_9BACT|nr:MraY family glycosyltransferase [Chloracidobacterium validum]QUW04482.1 undecaprenyl/decaprenyl-phosphate alpha-N-acetylglucosaminyl 1-phosphate transferase [Chloracidobacterium validum]